MQHGDTVNWKFRLHNKSGVIEGLALSKTNKQKCLAPKYLDVYII